MKRGFRPAPERGRYCGLRASEKAGCSQGAYLWGRTGFRCRTSTSLGPRRTSGGVLYTVRTSSAPTYGHGRKVDEGADILGSCVRQDTSRRFCDAPD
jgi:hypothetical protein